MRGYRCTQVDRHLFAEVCVTYSIGVKNLYGCTYTYLKHCMYIYNTPYRWRFIYYTHTHIYIHIYIYYIYKYCLLFINNVSFNQLIILQLTVQYNYLSWNIS